MSEKQILDICNIFWPEYLNQTILNYNIIEDKNSENFILQIKSKKGKSFFIIALDFPKDKDPYQYLINRYSNAKWITYG